MSKTAILTALVSLAAVLYSPIALRVKVLGVSRGFGTIQNIHGEALRVIPDTLYCEDLHHHLPSGLLFGASEDNPENRWKWFPPIAIFSEPTALGHGTIVVIDPKTFTATRLTLSNFPGPFVTHGIDIYSLPTDPTSVYIFAVNHLPNPAYVSAPTSLSIPAARSRIELFHHTIGSSSATHLRSIYHPLIRTPNDIYAINGTSFLVTNDHYYRSGLLRSYEDIGWEALAPWTDLIALSITDLDATNDTDAVTASVARKGIHNNNGLGHGRVPGEVLINDASAGVLVVAQLDPFRFSGSVQLPCTLDNPSYFADPYAAQTASDASGYVLAGLAEAAKFPKGDNPVMVWLVQPAATNDATGKVEWTQKLIFQDDGKVLRTASTAVLVGIDPAENEGRKQAWLFVTGPLSLGVAVSRVDL
ncbi:hypothetical protein MMC26_000626 [Xylographa opegraphella]|nr:hypothetical protein [Xylographa opegraphella]